MNLSQLFDEAETDSKFEKRVADDIPDGGPYAAAVDEFSCFREKDGDRIFVSWWFKLTAGLLAGKQIQRFSVLNDRTASMIKTDLARVVGRAPTFAELHDESTGQTGPIRREIEGARVEVSQSREQKGDRVYVNVSILRLVTPAEKAPSPAPKPSEAQPEGSSKEWHLQLHDADSEGPMTLDEIVARLVTREAAAAAVVWTPGLDDWESPLKVADFHDRFPASKLPPKLPTKPTSNDWADVEEGGDEEIPF